jgi:pimeloyl-ACP methyl ester carboxylesterase
MTSITPREAQQVEQANASGKTPVVFIHGLWLLPSSWDNWARVFEEAGYAAVTPSWPDDPETVEEARANPEILAKKTLGQIADHTAQVIGGLSKKPAVMGHSTGGLLTQTIAGRGLSAASVAIDPGPFRGVLPLPISSLRSAGPVLRNPFTGAAPSRSPRINSSTGGRTPSATMRRSSSTRPITWRRPAWR